MRKRAFPIFERASKDFGLPAPSAPTKEAPLRRRTRSTA